ncbi:hypothetical protein BKA70DRAFT_1229266 [Coprinopsis sp. MPI-PUGE-AT-0042]|nr:hypothetical protein BKA70DRAFT_1229266 [Coprinopsis sp. MPI-PUGE-AT-0042]
MTIMSRGNVSYTDLMHQMRRWFSKAGPSISLALSFKHVQQFYDEEEQLIHFIQEYQKCWRYLYLNMDPKQFWKLLTICPKGQWINLYHLGMSDDLIDPWQYHDAVSDDVSVDGHPLADHFPAVPELAVRAYYGFSPLLYPASQNTVERLSWYSHYLESTLLARFISEYRFLTRLTIYFLCDTMTHAPKFPNHVSLGKEATRRVGYIGCRYQIRYTPCRGIGDLWTGQVNIAFDV